MYLQAVSNYSRLWGRSDAEVMSTFASRYKPALVASNPTFTPKKDVSVVIPTLSPPAAFKACLQRIFENDPLEIIIVTTEEHLDKVTKLVRDVVSDQGLDLSKVVFVTSEQGARVQFTAGVEKAKGSIIAKCDDHIFWSRHFLTHMLACFEDRNVGAACPSGKHSLSLSSLSTSEALELPNSVPLLSPITRYSFGNLILIHHSQGLHPS